MKKILFIPALLLLVMSCSEKEPNPTETTPSLVGTWNTKTYNLKGFRNDVQFFDSTVTQPFSEFDDVIESIRFTEKMVYVTFNDGAGEDEPFEYIKKGNYLIITDGIESDTTFTISKLTSTELNFNFSEFYQEDGDKLERKESYTTIKK